MNSGQASQHQTRVGDGRKRPLSLSSSTSSVVLRRRGEESGLEAFLGARCINTQGEKGYAGISRHQNATSTSAAQQTPGYNLLASRNGAYHGLNKNCDTNKG
ncbi:hypothetical protein DCAR_0311712 [Daucus carota subsp. sativus]|uniref:Uncharacterized protein n=1 Tax=Daucus carota subsp. sativus TaxID=79200 RepID=A0A166AN55_DAUCS|nr:hypothetical protein DCAR_0311712 [Daucus carota subsp. sativus]